MSFQESIERHTCSLEGEEDSSQPKEDILHTCNICGTQLGTRRSLNTHLRSVHGVSIIVSSTFSQLVYNTAAVTELWDPDANFDIFRSVKWKISKL